MDSTAPRVLARDTPNVRRNISKNFWRVLHPAGVLPPTQATGRAPWAHQPNVAFPHHKQGHPTLCAKSLFEKYTSSPVHRTMGRIFDRMAHSTPIWGRKRPGGFARLCGRKRGDGVPDLGGTTLDGRTIGHNLFDGFCVCSSVFSSGWPVCVLKRGKVASPPFAATHTKGCPRQARGTVAILAQERAQGTRRGWPRGKRAPLKYSDSCVARPAGGAGAAGAPR